MAGPDHTCGLGRDGVVTCWGDDAALVAATPPLRFETLASGERHVCGVTSAGAVARWGGGEQGQAPPPPDLSGAPGPYAGPAPVGTWQVGEDIRQKLESAELSRAGASPRKSASLP
ncbi:MAG TPA: RCC1 domain-containing protein [Polyangiaceae bacterium]|nr:RCC1 domain-containing protein [Polyangiaceae bacterium]